MLELLLVIVVIVLAAKGDYTLLWIIGGMIGLAFISCLFGKGNGTAKAKERPRLRIDHPHYIDADDHECGVCGHRFRGNSMSCPHCGVRFNGKKENWEAFDEEEDEWAAWDEEEGW